MASMSFSACTERRSFNICSAGFSHTRGDAAADCRDVSADIWCKHLAVLASVDRSKSCGSGLAHPSEFGLFLPGLLLKQSKPVANHLARVQVSARRNASLHEMIEVFGQTDISSRHCNTPRHQTVAL